MNRVYSPETQCINKRPFQRRRDAKRAAAKMGTGCGVYACVYCDKFHVGHDPQRRK